MDRAELVEATKTADVLVPTITDIVDASVIGQAGDRLKLISNYGAGVDNIDVSTARQRGILVSNTPGVLTDDTADMTMALILAVSRRIPEGMREMQVELDRRWRAEPKHLVCRYTIITVDDCALKQSRSWKLHIGIV
jgi:lactate dehydrogenase-like 2-hydroxyacid dehydrogenase